MTEKNNDKVVTGMITKGVGGLYTVRCDDGEKPRSIEEISGEIYEIVKRILA